MKLNLKMKAVFFSGTLKGAFAGLVLLGAVCCFVPACAGTADMQAQTSADLQAQASSEEAVVRVVKGPYLIYPGEPGSMLIRWQLDGPGVCTLEWGKSPIDRGIKMHESPHEEDFLYSQKLDGLESDRLYDYRLMVGDAMHVGSFRTAPDPDARDLKFLAMGDTRTNPHLTDQVTAGINELWAQDREYQTFVIHVGDWVGNGDKEGNWSGQFFTPSAENTQFMLAHLPMQGCMGNHEKSGVLFKKYWPYPFVDHRYWSFDYGPLHVAVVDQYGDYTAGSSQLAWLEKDLAATDRPWKVIVLHEPAWSAGGHKVNVIAQEQIQPLCEAHRVDIIFAGHNHYYARCMVNGIAHVTTGGGGAPLRDLDMKQPHVVAGMKTLQFCKVEIKGNRLVMTAVTPEGKVIDEMVLEH